MHIIPYIFFELFHFFLLHLGIAQDYFLKSLLTNLPYHLFFFCIDSHIWLCTHAAYSTFFSRYLIIVIIVCSFLDNRFHTYCSLFLDHFSTISIWLTHNYLGFNMSIPFLKRFFLKSRCITYRHIHNVQVSHHFINQTNF